MEKNFKCFSLIFAKDTTIWKCFFCSFLSELKSYQLILVKDCKSLDNEEFSNFFQPIIQTLSMEKIVQRKNFFFNQEEIIVSQILISRKKDILNQWFFIHPENNQSIDLTTKILREYCFNRERKSQTTRTKRKTFQEKNGNLKEIDKKFENKNENSNIDANEIGSDNEQVFEIFQLNNDKNENEKEKQKEEKNFSFQNIFAKKEFEKIQDEFQSIENDIKMNREKQEIFQQQIESRFKSQISHLDNFKKKYFQTLDIQPSVGKKIKIEQDKKDKTNSALQNIFKNNFLKK